MTRIPILGACLLSMISFAMVANAQGERAGQLHIESYTFKTYDGKEYPAELGKLWVRENRNSRNSPLIQLAFIRLRSTSPNPAAPIVFLAGGPGIPGIGLAQVPVYFPLFERLREVADVILLDQRGTGISLPNLQCPAISLPLDVFEKTEKLNQTFSKLVTDCSTYWRSKGVDLTAYNSNASADDLEDIRHALRAERLSLLAWSYGTELALATIRRHGERLHQVALVSTRGPDNLLKLPSVWDWQVKKLSRLAGEDSAVKRLVPDLEALMKSVLGKLQQAPINIEINDRRKNQKINLVVGKIGLQTLIRADLSDARAFVSLPALLYSIDQGDYSIFKRRMEQLYNSFGFSAMGLAVDCSAGWSPERFVRAQNEARQALLSNVNLQWSPEICKQAGSADLGSEFRSRIWSNIATLFISGTLDPNTPPFQAEEIRWGFPNSTHLIVENAGHEPLPAPQIQTVIIDFFKGQDVKGRSVLFPRPRFLSLEEAKSR